MRNIVAPMGLVLLALLLSACSIISDLIPEQEVELFNTGNETNTIEATTEVSSEPPQSMEDFFGGASPSLESQATGDKYIAINVMRQVKDLDEGTSLSVSSKFTQEFGVSKIVLESATAVSFPDEIKTSFVAPNFLMWDGFVAPEETKHFLYLPKERQAALIASYSAAVKNNLALLISQQAFKLGGTLCVDGYISCSGTGSKVENQSTFYEKNSAECSETRCSYEFKGKVELCGSTGCYVYDSRSDVNADASYGIALAFSLQGKDSKKIVDIISKGEKNNSASLSVWLKVKSSSDTPIPAGVTAKTSLFLPSAKAKADFSSN